MMAGDEVYPDDVTSGPDALTIPLFPDHPSEATVESEYRIVERPDLSRRTALSKTVLTQFDLCPTKTWFGIHDPRPWVGSEKMTFGSAVDAGVEVIVKGLSSGQKPDLPRAFAAAAEVVERDAVEVVFSEVEDAIESFVYGRHPVGGR